MEIHYGIQHEGFKYITGVPHSFERNMPPEECSIMQNKSAFFSAARNDWVAFQLLLKADEQYTVSIGKRAVFSPYGALSNIRVGVCIDGIKGENINMYHIGLVQDDDGLYKSDILLHDEVIHAIKDDVKIVWIEIQTPEDAKPGIYSGNVNIYCQSMFEDEKVIAAMPFEIEVKDILLPKTKDYKFHLDLWQHPSNIARKHEVVLWSEDHFRILEHYIQSLSELGQKSITIIASEIPWSGQGCFRVTNYYSDMFEYSYIPIEKDERGVYAYNFSNVEKYINLCLKYGINGDIDIFGLSGIWFYQPEGYGKIVDDYFDNIRVRYLDKKDGCFKYMRKASEIKDYVSAIEQFFISKGWIGKVRVITDEPEDTELYNNITNFLKEAAPSLKYKVAINHTEFVDKSAGRIEDLVLSLNCTMNCWDKLADIKKSIGGKVLWYVACGPKFPNTLICSPPIESRFIGLLTAYMDMDGFLRWNYTVWPEEPRKRIAYKYPLFPAGDTNFVYPANDGRPLLTLRYKNLKRGIQDFELIRLLKESNENCGEILNEAWSKVFKKTNIKISNILETFSGDTDREELYSLNYEDYDSLRKTVLQNII